MDNSGSAITTENVLDVLRDNLYASMVLLKGIQEKEDVRITNLGSLSFGFDLVDNVDLAISKNIMINHEYQTTQYISEVYDSRVSVFNPSDSLVPEN